MSDETVPVHNDVRYEVSLDCFKENNYIIYEMRLRDLGMGYSKNLFFRFSELVKFHEKLKTLKWCEERLPDFPSKKSIAFWNKTNSDPKKV